MNNYPLVTCAFTAFNAESTIANALKSAFRQDYRPIEIIIVDDNSIDNTIDVIKELRGQWMEKIYILRNEANMGVAYSRNILLKKAKGRYISFFDDDDYSLPSRITEQVTYLLKAEEHNENVLVYSDRVITNMTSKKTHICKGLNITENYNSDAILSLLSCRPLDILSTNGSSATCTLTADVLFLKSIHGFDEAYRRYEDLEIAIRSLKYGAKLCSLNKILVFQNYSSSQYKLDSWSYNLSLINKYKELYPSWRHYHFARIFTKLRNTPIFTLKFCFYLILLSIVNPQLILSYFYSFIMRSFKK